MDFVEDPALRKHLQPFYDAGYADCVNENSLLHAQLQSEEVQEFLREHDFYHSTQHVPLPPFTVEEIRLSENIVGCRVKDDSFTVWGMGRGESEGDFEVKLDPLQFVGKREGPRANVESDVRIFRMHARRQPCFTYCRVGITDVFAIDSSFYSFSYGDNQGQHFWVNGEFYHIVGRNKIIHLASGQHEIVEDLLGVGDSPLFVFTYQNSFYQIYYDGSIRRARFEVREPTTKPFSKKKTLRFFENQIRELCQESLNKFESKFRSLGDYHARFGIQTPKAVVPLILEIDVLQNFNYHEFLGYENGVLRIARENEITNWNLVTRETTSTPARWGRRISVFGHPIVGDLHEYELEFDYVVARTRSETLKFNTIYYISGYKTKSPFEGTERKAAFINRSGTKTSLGVFVFEDEWYGLSHKGVTHLASNVLVSPQTIENVTAIFCTGNDLHIFTYTSYTRYRLHRG
jgi:hypothetical protein